MAGTPPPATTPRSPYGELATYRFPAVLVGLLVLIAWLGHHATEGNRVSRWFWILVLTTAFVVTAGRAVTGYWRGILIDNRNKLSLSRLQIIAWTILILSTLLTAAMTNVALGSPTPLGIVVPSALWVVMGISTASAVASPVILNSKQTKQPDQQALEDGARAMNAQGLPVPSTINSVIVEYDRPDEACWSDLLKGEEFGNAANVDVGKLQMLLFTFILIVGYAAAIQAMFAEPGPVLALPEVDEGMNVLLGISHTGYLSLKSVAHTPEA